MGSAMESYTLSPRTQEVVDGYSKYVGGGFAPYPIALTRVKGWKAWDVDEKEYLDFLSMYSVVNMGHGHPKILAAAIKAMEEGAVINLPFHSPYYAKLAEKLHGLFGYDKFVAMTSGGEAADAAVKIARKWGYKVKSIKDGECHVLTATACYHGVTLSTISLASKKNSLFGPFIPQVGPTSPSGHVVRYGEIEDLRIALDADGDKISAYMIEPIQGSAGIIPPPGGYIKEVAALCKKHNVLFIVDEVQAGLGRSGANLCHLRDNVRPDVVVLGKALAGGMYALSGVMCDSSIMDVLDPYEIGSTMASNPVGCAAAIAALDVLVDEDLSNRANTLGALLISTIKASKPPHLIECQGAGLFWSLVLDPKPPQVTPRRLVALLIQRGVLVSPAGQNRIRLCPPLTISEEDILKGAGLIVQALKDVESMGLLPGEDPIMGR